jgi:hypothetical protein
MAQSVALTEILSGRAQLGRSPDWRQLRPDHPATWLAGPKAA